jgi:hypothetical protein
MKLPLAILLISLQIWAACAYDDIEFYLSDGSTIPSVPDTGSYQSYSYSYSSGPISSAYNEPVSPYAQGKAASNALWIQRPTGELIQSMQCAAFSQFKLVAYSPGGPATMTEVYPNGYQTHNFYQFQPGPTELVFVADQPGKHILSYELNGHISNAVIVDVFSSDSGLPVADGSNEVYLGPISATPLTPLVRDNLAPELNSLTPDKSSPQIIGNPIIWTANAYDSDGDPIYYKFWLLKENNLTGDTWLPMGDWSTEDTCTWIPDSEGNYRISVMVRDGHHTNSPDGGDSSMDASFRIMKFLIYGTILPANKPPVIEDFSTDRPRVNAGNPKVFTVLASDPDGDQIYYKFWLMGPNTDLGDVSNYRAMTDWITENSWTWTPSDYEIGYFDIMVDVRDGHNALPSSWDDFSEIRITVYEPNAIDPYIKTLAKGSKKRPRNK